MAKIIGHRGAAGIALENSQESLLAALEYDIDAVEFDIHRTKDGRLVVLHDRHTGRIADKKVYVNAATLVELQNIQLKNGQHIPTLDEVMDIVGTRKPITIDIKDSGTAEELLRVLARHPKTQVSVTSFRHRELEKIRAARPEIPVYILEHFSPFDIVHTAHRLQATGVSLNMWLMNPLTYRMARRYGLELRVYTVNNPWLVRFFQRFYPDVAIYTDHPQRFVGKTSKT